GKDDGRHWVAPVYEARIVAGEPKIMEPEKHGDWAWVAKDKLPDELTTPTRQYLESTATA
ncbi:MAG: ADP-ribose pyrophosphatase, partial [Pseudomonadota bacterium]